MDIQKEFDRWWNTFKSQATRQYPVKADREAWVACAMLMADRVKELEGMYKALNDEVTRSHTRCVELEAEIKRLKERCEQQIWNLGGVSTLLLGYSIDEFNKEYALPALLDTNKFVKKHKDLQTKLDEAVEIIKTISKNANHYDKIDLQNKAEQFLSSLDKPKEE